MPAQHFEQTRTRIQPIVKPGPTIVEEKMAAHLAGERRIRLLQLGLDQRMPGVPHRRPAAVLTNPRREQARALDVEDDLAAGIVREHVLREQHDLPIRVNDLAILGDHPQAIAIAVECEPDLRIGLAQAANQILQVLRMRRIRMVIRKRAVDFAEQLDDLATQAPIKLGATAPATPLPQSIAIFIGRASLTSPVIASRYAGTTSTLLLCPRRDASRCALARAAAAAPECRRHAASHRPSSSSARCIRAGYGCR